MDLFPIARYYSEEEEEEISFNDERKNQSLLGLNEKIRKRKRAWSFNRVSDFIAVQEGWIKISRVESSYIFRGDLKGEKKASPF